MPVASLQLTNLGPFDDVSFEFDPQVNVFVGPNNCGKTTVLLALADILVASFHLPKKLGRATGRFRVAFEHIAKPFETVGGSLPVRYDKEMPYITGVEGRISKRVFRLALAECVRYSTFVPAVRQTATRAL